MFKFNKKLQLLGHEFQRRERQCERVNAIEAHQFLVVRLDGIGLTRRFSKKRWQSPILDRLMEEVIEGTYQHLFFKHRDENQNWFVGIARFNDELSFIFMPGKNHFDQRMFKIVSTLNGLASAYATNLLMRHQQFEQRPLKHTIAAFDARPVLLSSLVEVERYLFCRYGFARLHTTQKLLNLTQASHDIRSRLDLDFNLNAIQSLGLSDELTKMEQQFWLYVPDADHNLRANLVNHQLFFESLTSLLFHRMETPQRRAKSQDMNNLIIDKMDHDEIQLLCPVVP